MTAESRLALAVVADSQTTSLFSGDGATLTAPTTTTFLRKRKEKKKPPTFFYFFLFGCACVRWLTVEQRGGVSTTPCDVITPTKFLSRLSRQLYLYHVYEKNTSDIVTYGGKSSKIAQQLVKLEKRENLKTPNFYHPQHLESKRSEFD
jgi:hypothetical protein